MSARIYGLEDAALSDILPGLEIPLKAAFTE
jgi:hypothetical protein